MKNGSQKGGGWIGGSPYFNHAKGGLNQGVFNLNDQFHANKLNEWDPRRTWGEVSMASTFKRLLNFWENGFERYQNPDSDFSSNLMARGMAWNQATPTQFYLWGRNGQGANQQGDGIIFFDTPNEYDIEGGEVRPYFYHDVRGGGSAQVGIASTSPFEHDRRNAKNSEALLAEFEANGGPNDDGISFSLTRDMRKWLYTTNNQYLVSVSMGDTASGGLTDGWKHSQFQHPYDADQTRFISGTTQSEEVDGCGLSMIDQTKIGFWPMRNFDPYRFTNNQLRASYLYQ